MCLGQVSLDPCRHSRTSEPFPNRSVHAVIPIDMQTLLTMHSLVVMEAAVNERLRRAPGIRLHERLGNAPLVLDSQGQTALRTIYQEYIDIAAAAGLPLFLYTPTWRADRARVEESGVSRAINVDATEFMCALREAQANPENIGIGGLLGPRNDCYRPEEGLSVEQAREYHAWQIGQLVRGGVDFLVAQTMPNVDEALGMAQAMGDAGAPYLISFVIDRNGHVLDGCELLDAVHRIDANTEFPPLGYMVNCAYPSFLRPQEQPIELFERMIGYQANASSLDHCELDGADHLHGDPVGEWAALMVELNRRYGMKLLGGCCGTNGEHLRHLVGTA